MEQLDWNAKVKAVSKCDINGKACFIHLSLINMFDCNNLDNLVKKYIEPVRIQLTKKGEDYNNHIIEINIGGSERFYYCSPYAVRCMASIARNAEWMDFLEYSTYEDTSFFADPTDLSREVRVGDKVEIIVDRPDVIYPATPIMSYRGKQGTIVETSESGNMVVIVNPNIPAVEFKKSSLKRILR